jgi:hypothetical protein
MGVHAQLTSVRKNAKTEIMTFTDNSKPVYNIKEGTVIMWRRAGWLGSAKGLEPVFGQWKRKEELKVLERGQTEGQRWRETEKRWRTKMNQIHVA